MFTADVNFDLETLVAELKIMRPALRRARIDDMVESGELTLFEKENKSKNSRKASGFDIFMYKGVQFTYQRCHTCSSYVAGSNGGHRTKHLRKECLDRFKGRTLTAHHTFPSSTDTSILFQQKFPIETKDSIDFDLLPTAVSTSFSSDVQKEVREQKVLETIAKYCLASGIPFKEATEEPFRELVMSLLGIGGASVYELSQIRLPTERELENYCEEFKFPEIFNDFTTEISSHIRNRSASIYIDMENLVKHWITAFIVYIKLDQNADAKIEICPFFFVPIGRLHRDVVVKASIIEAGERFGVSQNEIMGLNVVMDGKNIPVINEFASCCKSGVSNIQNIAIWILNPTKLTEDSFTTEELKELEKCQELIDAAFHVASRLVNVERIGGDMFSSTEIFRSRQNHHQVKVAQELFEVHKKVEKMLRNSQKWTKELMEKLDWSRLPDIVNVFNKFQSLFQIFEKNEVSIHHFLPKLTSINEFFKQELEGIHPSDKSTKVILAKSAQLVTQLFIEREICDLHYKTTMLSPGHRRMSKLGLAAKERAIELIRKELKTVTEAPETFKIRIKREDEEMYEDDDYDDPMNPSKIDDELEAYLEETMLNRDEPLVFWTKRKLDFPRLSQVAFRCFSLISTQKSIDYIENKLENLLKDANKEGVDPNLIEKRFFAVFHSNRHNNEEDE